MNTTPTRTIQCFDANGNLTYDEARYTRVVVTDQGRVITEIDYLDAAGNPIPFAHAWQVCQADYDADGNVTGYSPGVITVDGEAYDPDEEYRPVLPRQTRRYR